MVHTTMQTYLRQKGLLYFLFLYKDKQRYCNKLVSDFMGKMSNALGLIILFGMYSTLLQFVFNSNKAVQQINALAWVIAFLRRCHAHYRIVSLPITYESISIIHSLNLALTLKLKVEGVLPLRLIPKRRTIIGKRDMLGRKKM